MVPTLTAELRDRIGRLKVADLADGCLVARVAGVTADERLRPAIPHSKVCGSAVTVRAFLGPARVDYGAQMADVYDAGRSVPYAVLVQRNEVPGFTSMGSGGARVARAHGYVGCLVDGPIRDTDELREIPFPLFGTSIRPGGILVNETPPGTAIQFETGAPIEVAGMPISPGDVVVADNDGAIVIPPAGLEAAVAAAESILREEEAIFTAVEREGLTYRQFLARRAP